MLYVLNPKGYKLRPFKNLVWNNEICKIVYMTARDIKQSFAENRLDWKNVEKLSKHKYTVQDTKHTVKYETPVKISDYPCATVIPFGYSLHIELCGVMYKNCTVKGGKQLETDMPVMYKDNAICIYDEKDGFIPILLS